MAWKTVEKIGLAVSTLAGITGVITDLLGITDLYTIIRGASILGFVISMVLLYRRRNAFEAHPKILAWYWFVPPVWAAIFFTWVGSWVISPQVIADAHSFAVEQGSVMAIPYQGIDLGAQGKGKTWIVSSLKNKHISTSYEVEYDLPKENSFAGISLWFSQPIDITEYQYLEFHASFGDPNARFTVILKESETIYNGVILGDGKVISAKTDEQVVRLPLSKFFPSVNYKEIRKIDFQADNRFVTGNGKFRVSDIRFTK